MESTQLDGIFEFGKLLNFGKMVSLFVGIAAMWFVAHVISVISSRIGHTFPSRRLLVLQIATVLTFALYIGGSILLLYGVLRPPKELMIALGGSAAVAIGLALKDLVSSLVAGLILLFDRPFQVGDRVTFGDTYGEITSIGLRAVRLATLDDNLVTIPNSRFVTDVVASGNAGALTMMVPVVFYLAVDCDLEQAREIAFEIVVTSRYVYLKKPVAIIVEEKMIAERLAIELRAKAYVLDVKYEKAYQTDIVSRVEAAFRFHGIKRPHTAPITLELKREKSQVSPVVS